MRSAKFRDGCVDLRLNARAVLLGNQLQHRLSHPRLPQLDPRLLRWVRDVALDFTNAYFHRPEELTDELRRTGFEDVRIFGVEGPAWTAVDAAGPEGERLMDSALLCARALEEDVAMLPSNAHLLGVGRAPK